MTDKPPSPWDNAAIRTADTRKRENVGRRQEAASFSTEALGADAARELKAMDGEIKTMGGRRTRQHRGAAGFGGHLPARRTRQKRHGEKEAGQRA